ncbi:hypothetical protein F4604DRAFT_1923863 [Suillus subluteus]|nr:hypothetical protein F4604DRAFT_1923863 [Suillus subluteus]
MALDSDGLRKWMSLSFLLATVEFSSLRYMNSTFFYRGHSVIFAENIISSALVVTDEEGIRTAQWRTNWDPSFPVPLLLVRHVYKPVTRPLNGIPAQITETYRAQLYSILHLSPLHGVGNNPPQHDDLFISSQGFPTPSPDLRRLQGFPTPSPDLGRQGPYMYGGGQQQTLLAKSGTTNESRSIQHGSHTAYDEQLQNLNSIVAKLVSEVAI